MGEVQYFQRLKDVIDGLEGCTYDDDKYWDYKVEIIELKYEALVEDISLSSEEESFVLEAALEHLKMGGKGEFLSICSILAYTGSRIQSEPIETSLTHHPDYKVGCQRKYDLAIDLLTKAGVFESGEKVLYYDVGILGVQKKDVGRTGLLILTDRRIVAVGGFFTGLRDKRHKLFYGDLREPYLSTLDFVCLDKMTNFELKKDGIRVRYVAEYIVEKDRTFYGPYFFKFDLPTSTKVKSGEVKLFISLSELNEKSSDGSKTGVIYFDRAYEIWHGVQLPSDYDRSRLEVFYRHILSQSSVSINGG